MIRQIIRFKIKDLRLKKNLSLRAKPGTRRYLAKRSNLNSKEIAASFVTLTPRNDRFFSSIQKPNNLAIIAELKFASPASNAAAHRLASSNIFGSPDTLIERAKAYEKAGVDAISVITEQYFFKGDIRFVQKVKKAVRIPVLQKDFVIDASQIDEAKHIGSDALLLIARIVSKKKLKEFVEFCFAEGIEPVVEINSEADLEKAVSTSTRIIAVNARDLDTFEIDIQSACGLMQKVPVQFTRLGFSGIVSEKEAVLYKAARANAILIGTAFMKHIPSKKDTNRLRIKNKD